jgi:hypothetical protein
VAGSRRGGGDGEPGLREDMRGLWLASAGGKKFGERGTRGIEPGAGVALQGKVRVEALQCARVEALLLGPSDLALF